mgnify:CR=1 FL=1
MTQVDYLIEKTIPNLGGIRKYYILPGNRWVDLDSVIVANTHQGFIFADDGVDKESVKDKLDLQTIIELTFCDGISVSTIYDDTMKNRFPIRTNEPNKPVTNEEPLDFYGEMYLTNNKDYCKNPYTNDYNNKKETVKNNG